MVVPFVDLLRQKKPQTFFNGHSKLKRMEKRSNFRTFEHKTFEFSNVRISEFFFFFKNFRFFVFVFFLFRKWNFSLSLSPSWWWLNMIPLLSPILRLMIDFESKFFVFFLFGGCCWTCHAIFFVQESFLNKNEIDEMKQQTASKKKKNPFNF